MNAGMIVALILLPFVWMLLAAQNKAHRDETGVNAPTRHGWRRIRRNARKKEISAPEAYNQWLDQKGHSNSSAAFDPDALARPVTPAPMPLSPPLPEIPPGLGEVRPPAIPARVADEKEVRDRPLHAAAAARRYSLRKQRDGYLLVNLTGTKLLTNPYRRTTFDFSREEVERFLAPTTPHTPSAPSTSPVTPQPAEPNNPVAPVVPSPTTASPPRRRIAKLPKCITFFDVETTGFNPTDRIVTLAAIKVLNTDFSPTSDFTIQHMHLIFDPRKKSHPKAEAIHGYSDWVLRHQDDFGSHAKMIEKFFASTDLVVAHNAAFDVGFYNVEMEKAGRPRLQKPIFCTMRSYRLRYFDEGGSMDDVCRRLGVARAGNVHGALEDAWLAMRAYFWLKERPFSGLMPQTFTDYPVNMRPVPPLPVGALPRRRRKKSKFQPTALSNEPSCQISAADDDATSPDGPGTMLCRR
jgi:DNA polymerase-3 subunit epsilon